MRPAVLRHSWLGFGGLVRRDLTAAESRRWVDAVPHRRRRTPRRDDASPSTGRAPSWRTRRRWLARFDRPVLLAGRRATRSSGTELAARLLATFPDATLVEFPDARTFVSLDEPAALADAIVAWAAPTG